MIPSASTRAAIAVCNFGVISCDTRALATSAAISRSSTTVDVTFWPWHAANSHVRSAIRSASNLLEDGSLVPALMITSLNGSCLGLFMSASPPSARPPLYLTSLDTQAVLRARCPDRATHRSRCHRDWRSGVADGVPGPHIWPSPDGRGLARPESWDPALPRAPCEGRAEPRRQGIPVAA